MSHYDKIEILITDLINAVTHNVKSIEIKLKKIDLLLEIEKNYLETKTMSYDIQKLENEINAMENNIMDCKKLNTFTRVTNTIIKLKRERDAKSKELEHIYIFIYEKFFKSERTKQITIKEIERIKNAIYQVLKINQLLYSSITTIKCLLQLKGN